MTILKIVISFLILGYSINAMAYEASAGNISTFFGPYVFKTDFKDTSTGLSSPKMGGAGLIVLGDVNDHGSLEIGLFYFNKNFLREQSGQYIMEQTAVAHVSMGYRRWWNDVISSSLSFYSAYSVGDFKTLHSDFPVGSEIPTSARDTTEYGMDLAVQSEIYQQERWAMDIEVRYSWSLTPKSDENANHYALGLGLRYLFQDKAD